MSIVTLTFFFLVFFLWTLDIAPFGVHASCRFGHACTAHVQSDRAYFTQEDLWERSARHFMSQQQEGNQEEESEQWDDILAFGESTLGQRALERCCDVQGEFCCVSPPFLPFPSPLCQTSSRTLAERQLRSWTCRSQKKKHTNVTTGLLTQSCYPTLPFSILDIDDPPYSSYPGLIPSYFHGATSLRIPFHDHYHFQMRDVAGYESTG